MVIQDMSAFITVRARAAYFLGCAEYAAQLYGEEIPLVRRALNMSWDWEEALAVSPVELGEIAADTDWDLEDGGLAFAAGMAAEKKEENILQVAASAVGYVARAAYKHKKNNRIPPDLIEATDSVTAEGIQEFIIQMPGFDPAIIEQMAAFLLEHHRADRPDDCGGKVEKTDIRALLKLRGS